VVAKSPKSNFKLSIMRHLKYFFLLLPLVIFVNCNKDSGANDFNPGMVYSLQSVSDPGILGKVTISRNSNGSSTVLVELNGTSTDIHPAFIYYNSLAQGGPVAITLNPIDCDCEFTSTVVTTMDTGNSITYEELINFNGHIKVHLNASSLQTVLLQGNIGSNVD